MQEIQTVSADHRDLIHDVSYDFYGKRMATCSSDQMIKVWDLKVTVCIPSHSCTPISPQFPYSSPLRPPRFAPPGSPLNPY